MKILWWCILAVILIGVFIIAIFAFVAPTYYRTYEFTSATPLNDAAGTWVFHLTNGQNLSLSNEYTADDVLANVTWTQIGGYIKVGYTFLGYPVAASYLPAQ